MSLPPGTILVDRWFSKCHNCGRETLPHKEKHDEISGYAGGEPGCGITFTHITSYYVGPDVDKLVRALRPDLEFIPSVSLNASTDS